MSFSFLGLLSIVLLVLGYFLLIRERTPLALRLLFCSFFMFSIALHVLYAVADSFTGEGINSAVIYHATQGFEGAGYSEYTGLITVSIAVFALGLFLSYWMIAKTGQRPSGRIFHAYGAAVAICASLLLNPASADLYGLFLKPSPATAMESGKGDFYKYYRQPVIKQTGEKKNLVFIYAESIERTFFNEDIFPGLITGLRELESRSTTFTNVRQVNNTTWTVAGIVASQCGLPLITTSHGNSMSGMDKFLSSARCLSDLLRDKGYYLSYYGGANPVFAGKRSFLKTHGFNEYFGWKELAPKLNMPNYRAPWGLYDDHLLSLAYRRFLELSNDDRDFALVTLTLDTHGQKGRASKSCAGIIYGDGSNPILNTVACSDFLITNFVKKILDSPFASNTIVVIASDHLAMKNTATDLLEQGDRTNMFMVIEPEGKANKIDKHASTLDIAPTILPFMGFKGNVGLGRNIADKNQSEAEIKYIQENFMSWKSDIERFWAFPKIKEDIVFDVSRLTMLINESAYYLPALVELTPELETRFKFNFSQNYNLADYVLALDKDTHFLLFDECRNTYKLMKSDRRIGYCIIAGKGGQYRDVSSFAQPEPGSTSIVFSPEDIRFLTGIPSEGGFRPLRIAHAGGIVEGKYVTNSFDALNLNIQKGFAYFELDFNFTSDGQLACIHDWDKSFERQFGFPLISLPTLKEFKRLVKNSARFDMCTLDRLIPWLNEHPTAKIVTDVKGRGNNIRALRIMAEKIPDFGNRIIPQIYHPESYSIAKDMGYEQVIWTLYRYKGSNDDVIKWVDQFNGPFAITMPEYRATSPLPMLLARKHIPTYVHTINKREQANVLLNRFSVTELYTDSLYPGTSLAYSMP